MPSLLAAWEGVNAFRITENEDTQFGRNPKPFRASVKTN